MGIYANDETSDTPEFTADLSGGTTPSTATGVDKELQDFLLLVKQKAEFNAQIHEFNDICWEKCFTDKPGSKLGGKAETCLDNCVNRFIDVSLFISNRFAMNLQKGSAF